MLVEAGAIGFGVVALHPVYFVLRSIIVLVTIPQTKPIISITREQTTPIETVLAIDIEPLMN